VSPPRTEGDPDGGEVSGIEARVLDLVGEVSGLLDVEEFRDGLLSALRSEIPSAYVSLNQLAPDRAQIWSISEPPLPAEDHAAFARYALQNPLAAWHLRTRDGRPMRFSDIVTREQLHATDLYREVYSRLGVEFQIAFTLPSPGGRIMAIALSRGEHDFTDTERELLSLARPHLIQAYRNSLEFADRDGASGRSPVDGPDERTLQTLGLTPAQARVLRRIALGASTADIAGELQIAQRTVHKHLQRIYERLEVSDRSAAARKAWEAVAATRRT
jgi:DNA-binding CsgD family transcriptional regulator